MTVMKYLMMLFLMFGFSSAVLADDAEDCVDDLTTEENECEDDEGGVLFSADDADSLRPYLVWGVGIALLSSVESSDHSYKLITNKIKNHVIRHMVFFIS